MAPYRLLEHTADIRIEVSACGREELFAEAARAMTDVVTEVESVRSTTRLGVELPPSPPDLLLVDWLQELLYLFEVEDYLTAGARVELRPADGGLALSANLFGECRDPARHRLKVPIKAVTYHGLELSRHGDEWLARVVFDI